MKAEIESLNRQVEWLTQQLRLIQGQRFGASSERTQVISEQMSLFHEVEALTEPKVVEHIQAVYSCRCCEQKNDHTPMKKSVVPPDHGQLDHRSP